MKFKYETDVEKTVGKRQVKRFVKKISRLISPRKKRASNQPDKSVVESLKKMNAYLEHQNKILEELNREKNHLISIVAHDLRAPLNRSKGLANLLRLTPVSDKQKEIIKLMDQVNEEGLHLIEEILYMNSMEYRDSEPSVINLNQFIAEHISKFFADQANRKNIQIHAAIDEQLEISTDVQALRRIMDNLVSNALKFSPRNSHIFVRILSVEEAVYISVQDQGPGISKEDQKKLFRKFQRLSARPTSGEPSTGLGLAIVKELVERLHGEISVRSESGRGAEFIVRLNKEMKALRKSGS